MSPKFIKRAVLYIDRLVSFPSLPPSSSHPVLTFLVSTGRNIEPYYGSHHFKDAARESSQTLAQSAGCG